MAESDIDKYVRLLRKLFVPDEHPRTRTALWHGLLRRDGSQLSPPMVCLVGANAEGSTVRSATYRWLEASHRRAAPRVHLAVTTRPRDAEYPDPNEAAVEDCLWILDRLRLGLATGNTGMGSLVFPRYNMLSWVLGQRFGAGDDAPEELRSRMSQLLRAGRRRPRRGVPADGAVSNIAERVPLTVYLVLALWPVLWVWLRLSGRVPVLSREVRWFLGQRYLSPELSDGFLDFAGRLTWPSRSGEDPDQVSKLLVHAFLEDLRHAYRRRLLRPSSWRRTAYPVVLVHVADASDPAAELMRRINEIRNETGVFDPLVVVATMAQAPYEQRLGRLSRLLTENLQDTNADQPEYDPLEYWKARIEERRRRRARESWYLPVRLTDALAGVGELGSPKLARPPKAPWFARRGVPSGTVLALIVVSVVAASPTVGPQLREGCWRWPWESGIGVAVHGGECVGYSDSESLIFTDDAELREMQREVFRQNRIAEDIHRRNPRKTLVSVVYFAGLTYVDDNVKYPHAQVEELAGFAIRQRRAIEESSESEPLLRVIIANGGSTMRYASWVAEHLLSRIVRADSTLIGVVGLDRSTAETRRAIALLGASGVPVMPTTLSADGLTEVSPLYFQPVPGNLTQARLVADYYQGARYPEGDARQGQPRYTGITLYHWNDPDDIYVKSLTDGVRNELRGRGIAFEEVSWIRQQEMADWPAPCAQPQPDRQRLHYFAGRNHDFGAFVDSLTRGCPTPETLAILGNDAVTRFIADPTARAAAPPGLPIRYVAKAVPVLLGGAECVREGRGVLGDEPVHPDYLDMCRRLKSLVDQLDLYETAWPGDRTGLAYDVAGVFLEAVRRNQAYLAETAAGTVPARAAIATKLREIDYQGVTGVLAFSASRIANDTTIGILYTEDVSDEKASQQCLLMYGRTVGPNTGREPDGCPVGTRGTVEDWSLTPH
ncbi:hypothetical protein [Nocardia sp. NPDC127526]|uniref:hypothetical protein n=1 Tax=Nocardia sp. NPDC127526 TaxID=3345393 RepID=UPI003640F53D